MIIIEVELPLYRLNDYTIKFTNESANKIQ